ncbi:MAG: sigma-E processing peptidase SpoIIGA [Clostridia bacterium]|nr:sigma-E processing peptidase SpoIIGA [Clostridia bacterium]
MRVYGEVFLVMNGWMDYLCLLLAARLGRSRFHAGKALISAGLGAVYAVLAWTAKTSFLRGVPMLLAIDLLMCWIAFGRRCPRLAPLVMAAGCLLSGLSNFVLEQGIPPWAAVIIVSGAALALLLLTRQVRGGEGCYRLQIVYRGQSAETRALRDTGNLLWDGVSGLPVIVLPERLGRDFLPPGTNLKDLSTLPRGWRLLQVKTAAGSKALMCFIPDQTVLRQGTRVHCVEAVIAVAGFQENYALLPERLFSEQREEICHAVL